MTSPRRYDKQHQHRPGLLTKWTWDEYDSNTPCEACSQLEEPGATYLVRQCLKIADENTLWLLTSQPGDHDRQVVYDRANRTLPLSADGGAPVNLFTQGAIAGHAGPPQAGPAGAGPSMTLLQGQLMIAKALSVTVLLLPGVILLRDGQAHVYPPVPISETILSVTPNPFSLVLFIYCVLALESRLDTNTSHPRWVRCTSHCPDRCSSHSKGVQELRWTGFRCH